MKETGSPITVELFAGAGLLGYAFEKEGFRLDRAYERDRHAVATHRMNLGGEVVECDLSTYRPAGRCDVLLAGPPCQGFSTLGKRDPGDPRNALSLIVAEWSKRLRPHVVVVENVAAFLDSPVWPQLKNRLVRQGYDVTGYIFEASEYGAPQKRRRSFTIAVQSRSSHITIRRRKAKTVRDAWKGLSGRAEKSGMNYAPIPSELAAARFKHTPRGGDKRDIMLTAPHLAAPSWWRSPSAVTDVWGRMQWDEPSNTIRTAFQNPSKGRYVHPTRNRTITLREGARLQGIPDSWEFCGSPTNVAMQIGNGVPVPLGRALARALRQQLL